jgi:hypothetical protein
MRRAAFLAMTVLAAAGCSALTSDESPSRVRMIPNASIDPAYPIDSLRDLVSYADQVSVVTVLGERRLAGGSEEESGGLEGRAVTVRVEQTIWRGPAGTAAPKSFEFTTWGWSDGRPLGEEGGARLETGRRYLVGLAHGREEGRTAWWSFSGGAQLRLDGDTLDADDVLGEPSSIFGALAGLTVEEAGAVLARATPDPLAVKYARLGASKRWQAVARERG